jgi:preprotein translocase subunit SecG
MHIVLLVIHLAIALALVGVILLQRSEGGGLGMGGGNAGGFMSVRGAANLLTRATTILAAGFLITSLSLVILSGRGQEGSSVLDETDIEAPQPEAPTVPIPD